MFETQVFEHIAMEYRHNIKKSGVEATSASSYTKRLFEKGWVNLEGADVGMNKCREYLSKMWVEQQNK